MPGGGAHAVRLGRRCGRTRTAHVPVLREGQGRPAAGAAVRGDARRPSSPRGDVAGRGVPRAGGILGRVRRLHPDGAPPSGAAHPARAADPVGGAAGRDRRRGRPARRPRVPLRVRRVPRVGLAHRAGQLPAPAPLHPSPPRCRTGAGARLRPTSPAAESPGILLLASVPPGAECPAALSAARTAAAAKGARRRGRPRPGRRVRWSRCRTARRCRGCGRSGGRRRR